MHKTRITLSTIALMTAACSLAHADIINGTITADNHYSLYTSSADVFTYHGGNEIGAGGNPGSYNWSIAEPYTFDAGDFLYIAAWSDDSVAQGVLAQFNFTTRDSLMSGDPRWMVYGTKINRGDGDPHPDATEVAAHVATADSGNLWETPFVGDANGVEPWGMIADISGNARWMWKNVIGDPDPLHGGSGASEMLIFRTTIPAPGSSALLAIGGFFAARRRRVESP